MDFETVMHWIAQGAINISYGHTTIENGSPVHKAMHALCELVNAGKVRGSDGRVIVAVGQLADGRSSRAYQIGVLVDDVAAVGGEGLESFEDRNYPVTLARARVKLAKLREGDR